MNKGILTILLVIYSVFCYAQNIQTKYYKSEWLETEVAPEKAKFSKTINQKSDGTVTTEIQELKKEELEIYKDSKFKDIEIQYKNSFKPYKIIQTKVIH